MSQFDLPSRRLPDLSKLSSQERLIAYKEKLKEIQDDLFNIFMMDDEHTSALEDELNTILQEIRELKNVGIDLKIIKATDAVYISLNDAIKQLKIALYMTNSKKNNPVRSKEEFSSRLKDVNNSLEEAIQGLTIITYSSTRHTVSKPEDFQASQIEEPSETSNLINKYVSDIKEVQDNIRKASTLLRGAHDLFGESKVSPKQIEKVLHNIRQIEGPVRKLNGLLTSIGYSPLLPQLKSNLYETELLVNDLTQLLINFRSIYFSTEIDKSWRIMEQQDEIQSKLAKLLLISEATLNDISKLTKQINVDDR